MRKVTLDIMLLFTLTPFWTTGALMQYLALSGYSKESVSGGIGKLRAQGTLKIVSPLPYGHLLTM